jgi:preprotein translocase subunit YajC
MLQNFFSWTHANTPFHFWDWAAFVIAAVIVIVAIVHHRNQKKREEEFNKTMEETMTNLDQVMAEAGVAGASDAIVKAAEAAEIPGPKQAEAV